jgi:hypothetical protein
MKHLKILGLLTIAATALLAFVGAASASTVTSPAGTPYTGTIEATAGTSTLVGSFATVICNSATAKGEVRVHGLGVTAEGPVTHLAWSACNYEVTTSTSGGTLIGHAIGGGNGTITSTGAKVTVHTSLGTCVFTTNSTHLGTLKGGLHATLSVEKATIPRTEGNFLCGSSAQWTATYTVIKPTTLLLS